MNTALWIVAGLLAVVFGAAGLVKLIMPREKLVDKMSWTKDATDAQVKILGALELAGAIGLILPAILDVAPVFVPLAAIGLAVTMAGAIVIHVKHHEGFAAAAPAIVFGLLCAFVVYGRLGPRPF